MRMWLPIYPYFMHIGLAPDDTGMGIRGECIIIIDLKN